MPLALTEFEERKLNEAGLEFITYVSVIPAVGPAFHCCSGTRNIGHIDPDFLDWVQNIDSVGPIDFAIDPITRKTQIGRCDVRLVDDGTARHFVVNTTVKGARVVVRMGPADVPSQQIPCWRGILEDVTFHEGFVTLRCADDLIIAGDIAYYGLLVGEHPLEVAELILDLAGVDAANRDSSAFDPRTDRGISHFNVTGLEGLADANVQPGQLQYDPSQPTGYMPFFPNGLRDSGIALKGSALQYLDTIARHCGGSIYPNERGLYTFKRYVAPTAVHDRWDEFDVVDLEPLQMMEGMINEVHVQMGTGTAAKTYIYRDNQSQADHRHPSVSARKAVLELQMPLAGALLWSESFLAADLTLGLEGRGVAGMTGARVTDKVRGLPDDTIYAAVAPFEQPDGANLAEGRFVYIQAGSEIIRVGMPSRVDPETLPDSTFGEHGQAYLETNEYGGPTGLIRFYPRTFSVLTCIRGFGGTTAADHGTGKLIHVRDVTAPRMLAEVLVERCRNGLPKLRVRTTRAKYRYQVGDFIELNLPNFEFGWWGAAQLNDDNPIWWEITRKTFDPIGGSIEWELTFAKIATPQSTADPEDIPRDNVYETPQEDTRITGGKWHISADQSFAVGANKGAAGFATVVWDEESFAGIGLMDPDTGVWTCKRPGLYRIHAKIGFDVTGTPDGCFAQIYVGIGEAATGPDGTDGCSVEVTEALEFDDTVAVQVHAWISGGGTAVIDDPTYLTYLEITYLGPAP